MTGMTSKVLNSRTVNKDAKFVLICFPWAGGGSNFYANWSKLIPVPDFLEVCGITLPGREARYREPGHSRLHEHIQEVCGAITEKYNGRRLAFWGHSMGALLAFQTALKLKQERGLEPVRLFVSGISAPHSRKRKETKTGVHKMNDEEFKEYLRQLGGTPKEVLENKELMELFLPPLRADYSMLDQFEYEIPEKGPPPLTCPIDIFDGEQDHEHDLEAWKDLTASQECSIRKLPGGHFYLKDQQSQEILIKHFIRTLSEDTCSE